MVPGHGQVGEGVCVVPGHGGEAQAVARVASRLRGEGGRGAARVAQTGDGVVGQHLAKEIIEKKRNVKVRPGRPWSTGCPCCPTRGGKDQSESRRRSPSP